MSQSPAPPTSAKLFDSPEQEAYLQLWRTYDRLREIEEQVFSQHGLTAQQYNALRVLKSMKEGSLAISALGARLVSRAPDMTRMLDKLADRELVSRQRSHANRRVVEVSITPAGRELLKQLSSEVRRCGRDQLGHMDPADLKQLVRLLKEARRPHEESNRSGDAWPGNLD